MSEQLHLETFNQAPDPVKLSNHLHENYPYAHYRSTYEAGFTGFTAHRELENLVLKILLSMHRIFLLLKKKLQVSLTPLIAGK